MQQSPFLQGGVLQGRFLHFCMEDSYITNPPQYKNVRMTVFILYIRHSSFLHPLTSGDNIRVYVKMLESTAY